MTSVNLKCVYGDMHPGSNPHEVGDELAKKLIDQDLAELSAKKTSDCKALKEEYEEKIAELEEKVTFLDGAFTVQKEFSVSLENEIVKLQGFVESAINSAKGTAPEEWEEYKASKEV
jgi:hypothetical protein